MTPIPPTPAPSVLATEPVATAAIISALFKATLVLVLAFGVHLSDAQVAAVIGIETPLEAIGWILFVRSRVTPVPK